MSSLDKYRHKIDKLDDQMIQLLEERFQICSQVIHYKYENGIPMMQPERVTEVSNKFIRKASDLSIPVDFAKKFIKMLIQASCVYEDKILDQLKSR